MFLSQGDLFNYFKRSFLILFQLEKVYKFRMKHKEHMCSRSPLEAKHIIEHNLVSLLEEENHDGRRIMFFRIGMITLFAST